MLKLKRLNDIEPICDKGGRIYILLSPLISNNEEMIMGYAVTPPGESVKTHKHPVSEECFFVTRGSGRVVLETGESLTFEKGEAIRIPPNIEHSIENIGDEELCVLFASAPLTETMEAGHSNGE
jgi:quercetin dioxygenase-like cupin family protein